jgi:PAS domain S-box-containing protein
MSLPGAMDGGPNRRDTFGGRRSADRSQADLAYLIRSTADAITIETVDGAIRCWNDGAQRVYGYSADEVLRRPISILVPADRQDEERAIWQRLKQGQSIDHFQTVRVRKDRRPVDISLSISPVCDDKNNVIGAFRIARDVAITVPERGTAPRIDVALPEQRRRLQLALTASGAGAFRFDLRTTAFEYDDALARLWDLSGVSELADVTAALDRIYPDDRARFVSAIHRCAQEGGDFDLEHRIMLSSGGVRWVANKGKSFLDEAGRPDYLTGVSVDVTQRKRAEDALRESEERFRTFANGIPSILWERGLQGESVYLNQVWFDYTGQRPGTRDAQDWFQCYHPEDQPRLLAQRVENGRPQEERAYDLEARIRRHDGVYRWFQVRCAPIRNADGAVVKWGGTCTDIDDQKRAEQALREADRQKDNFLATLAHELRNPLMPIENAANIVKTNAGDNARLRYAGDVIARQVSHVSHLVDDLLDVSRIAQGKMTLDLRRCDVRTIVTRAVEMTRRGIEAKAHELRIDLPPEERFVLGDAARLIQLVSNLIDNAVKYTPPKGTIRISMRSEDAHVLIQVDDTGVGIAPELLPRIFDLFVQGEQNRTGSEGGLGIGLSLVKSLVQLHHGQVSVKSDGPGRGTEFSVRLPLIAALTQSDNAASNEERRESASAPRRVLIVEDYRDAADSLALLLKDLGHDVRTVYDGGNALRNAIEFLPDIAILDIDLPTVTGHELSRLFRQEPHLQRTVIVAMSGHGREPDRERARAAGFDHHLLKPPDMNELIAIIASAPGATG